MPQQTVVPQLRITSARRSLEFYVHGLGFTVDWEHQFEPGFPVFMQLTRSAQTIFLTEHTGDGEVGGAVYFVVPDVDHCFAEFSRRGVAPSAPPADTPWGTREMLIQDPDGNRLRFANQASLCTPESVVQRQLEAYNAKDLEAWLSTYSADAEQYELHGPRLARGHGEMRSRMQQRFCEPDLHAELLKRVVMANVVVDHERVTRNFPEGTGTIDMLCVYEVADNAIRRASFSLGEKRLHASEQDDA